MRAGQLWTQSVGDLGGASLQGRATQPRGQGVGGQAWRGECACQHAGQLVEVRRAVGSRVSGQKGLQPRGARGQRQEWGHLAEPGRWEGRGAGEDCSCPRGVLMRRC